MKKIHFEWDESKARSNELKHNVSFTEATSVFYDELAVEFEDIEHSVDEERFLLLGLSHKLKLLLICHCYKDDTGNIRIISARKATKNEAKHYPLGG
ncbi:MAG: BrnT family toxin [Sulfurovum sp.]|nr:BrnT family toxin [Sulfurovum sp.]